MGLEQLLKCSGFNLYPLSFFLYSPLKTKKFRFFISILSTFSDIQQFKITHKIQNSERLVFLFLFNIVKNQSFCRVAFLNL